MCETFENCKVLSNWKNLSFKNKKKERKTPLVTTTVSAMLFGLELRKLSWRGCVVIIWHEMCSGKSQESKRAKQWVGHMCLLRGFDKASGRDICYEQWELNCTVLFLLVHAEKWAHTSPLVWSWRYELSGKDEGFHVWNMCSFLASIPRMSEDE